MSDLPSSTGWNSGYPTGFLFGIIDSFGVTLFFNEWSKSEKKKEVEGEFEQWGAFYLLIDNFFGYKNIGGAKEIVALLWLSGDI